MSLAISTAMRRGEIAKLLLVAARKRCFPAVRTRFRELLVLDRGAIHAWPRGQVGARRSIEVTAPRGRRFGICAIRWPVIAGMARTDGCE